MNDTIIDDLYNIRNYLDQVKFYVIDLKDKKEVLNYRLFKPDSIHMKYIMTD